MWIIEDTRQQEGQHETKHKRFQEHDIQLIRCKLPFGDYALPPKVAIDTKKGIKEIAGNICGASAEHQRFKRECIAARDAGCKLIFLIENDEGITSIDQVHTWRNPRSIYSPNVVQGDRLEKAMKTMSKRYGCEFLFCAFEDSADLIIKLLEGEENEHDG